MELGHLWTSPLAAYQIPWKNVLLVSTLGSSKRIRTGSWLGWIRMAKSSCRPHIRLRSATCSSSTASKLQFFACSMRVNSSLAMLLRKRPKSAMINSLLPWSSCATQRAWCSRRRLISQCSVITRKLRWTLTTNQDRSDRTWSPRRWWRSNQLRPHRRRKTSRSRSRRSALLLCKLISWRSWKRRSSTASRICWPTLCATSRCSRPTPRWSKSKSKF